MPDHSPTPWKLAVAGSIWGLAAKGASAKNGDSDVAQGSTFSDRWRHDAALIQAAPKLLDALTAAIPHIADPNAKKAAQAAVRAATKPVQ